MKVYEKLTNIIKHKGLTRKEFAEKLIDLSPKVNRVGEAPTISTIYGYLNGRISIPIELVPYIADVLNIAEQEMFDTSYGANKKYLKLMLETSSHKELIEYSAMTTNALLIKSDELLDVNAVSNDRQYSVRLKEIAQYIKFAPISFVDKIIISLKKYKKLSDNF